MSEESRPVPEPDEVSRFYWEGASAGRLLLQRCAGCARFQFPPDIVCVHCQCEDLAPTAVSGRGSLYSYTVVERGFHQRFVDHLPYVVGLVELAEQAGLRILTNVVGADLAKLAVGMPVEVTFERRGDVALPQFRPAGEGG
ncbi:Zn-ribbon domain-containing OB-fold protein [Pseudofrankia inefficax]|uniref:DUF35 domain-containing protein n=1 Tax=Pseudofrankia inefficax (strain DSM 45817 / CECT 9037 / DDB 130130 / EuI1c) TaxID=298654 RepID=E3J7S4_PSEI1|nr:OB-fold domain-containing protein [Pseudofrankia inefficax]ADP80828.1 protein of unknown function DUF35 [Pseudofrankia inefficax]